ncbi:multicomponent Na+:H+ antiporter subunit A [Micromonospora phaseoli]|uniref:Multicomponent Na+:H+ antiporter subunit A n=1 Tax=Micromonospora phaseoli TaxID=1144548 RepID=A0A1H6UA08_9ACTN|nr:Na+/H+ antiporter subunit A [Micromonospora phaseoli]PZV98939.1 multisubunit sodium/proton antiporter MrpA subunit /multisubunit sodium/proton antiporter MrpB subunit [Micromonospora phaseoli]GIJ76310.1 monovalent cation/H+ antiporter subunit A [Micromonospora phaseoli]SEI89199.1 multicomponent Na+:H+ antiporter subunit A [Micromonospora phaseoli]
MLALVAVHALTAVIAPALVRLWGRNALYLVALVPGATLVWALTHTAGVRSGDPVVETVPWVPQLGLELALRMGTLSWLMVVLVGGVGALVLAYSARYFRNDDPGLGRFAAVFVAFAGAMLGLAVSDDLLLLYVFWELTTVFSYLLIGSDPAKRASRRAAMQALLVTTLGGLAMLAGFVMLGQHAGTYRWSEIAGNLPGGGYLTVAALLILLGALSKSAIFPFSFWLPGAMAAPTPVSAYLHAAAMVKAGVFLVALLGPALAAAAPWRPVLLATGLLTMFLGGWAALRQVDLKLLLAYGTVSQLGLLMVILGAGTRDTALAGAAMVLAHALFKATLFLTVGVIDHTAGTRDLRELSGLGRRAPALAVVAGLAAASMAGLPPMAGFVAKEAAVEALLHGGVVDLVVLAGVLLGSVLTVAYTLRFLWGAFADKPGIEATEAKPLSWPFLAPTAVLALAGVAVGLLAPAVDRLLTPYADLYPSAEPGYHLALWHGLTPALGLSALAVAGGLGLFHLLRRETVRASLRLPFDGAAGYQKLIAGVDRLAVELTGATQRGSLPFYLGVILVVLVLLPGGALLAGAPWSGGFHLWDTPLQAVAGAVVVVAAVMAACALRRLTAMILVGVAGYGIALMFILHGAPDLALTQFLVETVTIVMFVLVLRRLPVKFSERPIRASRRGRVAIGVAVGAVTAGMAYVAAGARVAEPVSVGFPDEAVSYGGGKNVVNVTLVDIRAWDTMGEIAVLVVAATGVASLIFRRARDLDRRGDIPGGGRTETARPRWLTTGATARAQSVILQVVTRLLFHAIVLFSIYLLFSGHNAPGGGFAAGLVAGLALAVRYLAGGRTELNGAAPVDAGVVLGAGLFVAVGTGVAAMLLGGEFLQSALLDFHLPVLGHIHFVTSVFFDVGVYLIVVGLVLDILRSLGAEMDRQQETEGGAEVREKELV